MSFRVDTIPIDLNLELRVLGETDAEELFVLVDKNRRYLRQWLPWLDMNMRVEDTMQFINNCRIQYENRVCFNTSIRYQGKIVGIIGYHPIDWANRSVMIGYWLAEDFQGKGIMTSACQALVDYAFNGLKLNRVDIRCATGNTKSCAIPQRLGFTFEGMLRQGEWLYDHFVDLYVFSMLGSEWKG